MCVYVWLFKIVLLYACDEPIYRLFVKVRYNIIWALQTFLKWRDTEQLLVIYIKNVVSSTTILYNERVNYQ